MSCVSQMLHICDSGVLCITGLCVSAACSLILLIFTDFTGVLFKNKTKRNKDQVIWKNLYDGYFVMFNAVELNKMDQPRCRFTHLQISYI